MRNPFKIAMQKLAAFVSKHKEEAEDNAFFRGEVEIIAKDSQGNIFFREEDKNVILDNGKYKLMDIMRDLAANKEIGGTTMSLCRFSIGDGGAEPATLNIPKATDKSRTTIYNEIRRMDITTHSKPVQNAIEFQVDILADDLVPGDFNAANGGEYVNEAGLVLSITGSLTTGNPSTPGTTDLAEVPFSHKTHKSIPFTPGSGITLTYIWRIYCAL